MKSTVTPMAGWYVVHVRVAWNGGRIIDGRPDPEDFDIEEQRFEVLALEYDHADHFRLVITGGLNPGLKIFTTDDLETGVSREGTCIERLSGPWHDELRPPLHHRIVGPDVARIGDWVQADCAANVMLEHLAVHGPATEAKLLGNPTDHDEDDAWRGREALHSLRRNPAVSWCAGVFSIREGKREEVLATVGVPNGANSHE